MTAAGLIEAHRSLGELRDVGGEAVFVADLPATDRSEGPPLLVVHGFPTSSIDWAPLLDRLREHRRVVLVDQPGYGLSAKPDRHYSIFGAADALQAVIRDLGIEELDLVTHDMGDTVGGELLARDLDGDLDVAVRRRVVTNGSIYLSLAKLTDGQQALWSAPDALLPADGAPNADLMQLSLSMTMAPPGGTASRPDPDHVRAAAELVVADGGGRLLPRLIRYLTDRVEHEDRFTGAIERHPAPLAVVWGDLDPIAVFPMAEQLRDRRGDAVLTRLEGVGHYPSLEAPDALADAVLAHLDG
jgi:pimeloyl-ACP methyl ester carboxylesterase